MTCIRPGGCLEPEACGEGPCLSPPPRDGRNIFRETLRREIADVEHLLALATDETKAAVTWDECGECRLCGSARWPDG